MLGVLALSLAGDADYESFYRYSNKLDRKTMTLTFKRIKQIDCGEVNSDKRFIKILDETQKKVDLIDLI